MNKGTNLVVGIILVLLGALAAYPVKKEAPKASSPPLVFTPASFVAPPPPGLVDMEKEGLKEKVAQLEALLTRTTEDFEASKRLNQSLTDQLYKNEQLLLHKPISQDLGKPIDLQPGLPITDIAQVTPPSPATSTDYVPIEITVPGVVARKVIEGGQLLKIVIERDSTPFIPQPQIQPVAPQALPPKPAVTYSQPVYYTYGNNGGRQRGLFRGRFSGGCASGSCAR